MLNNSFIHIKGIGENTEKKLWLSGIMSWENFKNFKNIPLSNKKVKFILRKLELSEKHINSNNAKYFYKNLKSNQHWRIFKNFKHKTAYLDIETTGLEPSSSTITTISIYDGKKINYYVKGDNLQDFKKDISQYKLLVTYNGKCFDIPFIEKYFNIKLNQAHIDLRYTLKSLGFSGGLKRCEKSFGINRGELEGVDGFFAVYLWKEFYWNKNQKALETLLAYNIEDVINLEYLMHKAYNSKLLETPFSISLKMNIPSRPQVPFTPDKKVISKIKNKHYYY